MNARFRLGNPVKRIIGRAIHQCIPSFIVSRHLERLKPRSYVHRLCSVGASIFCSFFSRSLRIVPSSHSEFTGSSHSTSACRGFFQPGTARSRVQNVNYLGTTIFSTERANTSRRRSCTGDDRASVEVSVSSEAMQVAGAALGPGNLSIAAIHYGGLDRTLRRRNHFACVVTSHLIYHTICCNVINFRASWSSGRNSSVVTVMVDFEAAPDNKQLKRSFNQRQLKFTIR